MAKFLIEAAYTAEGLRGLAKDKASGRKDAVETALSGVGGKLESMYFAFGAADVNLVCECPDNVSAAAISLAASASGLVRTRTVPLLTVEEADQALSKEISYRAPGAKKA
jgi:uncharacterized protein with GYD domain